MTLDRVPTGIKGFDPLIDGGFPRGSLILLAGNPGTGKTIFGANFAYHGATDYNENSVYASFAEGKKVFYEHMQPLGMDFEKLEKEGKFKILDLTVMKEPGASSILELILDNVFRMGAKRLVIDSFSAISQAFGEKLDARMVLHLILGRLVRQAGCTVLLIIEIPIGSTQIGLGIEEFVADGVLFLRRKELEGRLIREVEILKLRGTEVKQHKYLFSLKNGFQVFPPFVPRVPKQPKIWKPIPDHGDMISTGSQDVDNLLGGGFPLGSYTLLEAGEGVPYRGYAAILISFACNFVGHHRGMVIIPSSGLDAESIKKLLSPYMGEDRFEKSVRVTRFTTPTETDVTLKSYEVPLPSTSIVKASQVHWSAINFFRKKFGSPIYSFVGYDSLEYQFGPGEGLKVLGKSVANVKRLGDIRINLVRPGVSTAVSLKDVSDTHLKVIMADGAVLLYGVKPTTGFYNLEIDDSEGYPVPKLTPII